MSEPATYHRTVRLVEDENKVYQWEEEPDHTFVVGVPGWTNLQRYGLVNADTEIDTLRQRIEELEAALKAEHERAIQSEEKLIDCCERNIAAAFREDKALTRIEELEAEVTAMKDGLAELAPAGEIVRLLRWLPKRGYSLEMAEHYWGIWEGDDETGIYIAEPDADLLTALRNAEKALGGSDERT